MPRPTRTRSEAKSGRKGRTNSQGLTRLRGLTVRPLTIWGAVAVASPADDFGTPRGASKPVMLSIYLAPMGKSSLQARAILCSSEGRFAIVTNVGCWMRWTLWRL
jgi:hypothetical protein